MRLLLLCMFAIFVAVQSSLVDEDDFLYKFLLRTGVVDPASSSYDRAAAEVGRTKRCRWKLCGTGRRFRFVSK